MNKEININSIIIDLKQYIDSTYKEFYQNLGIPVEILGIRTPILDAYAKKIAKIDAVSFLTKYEKTCYETDVIYGFILGYAKLPYPEQIPYLFHFASLIDNWATCDLGASRQKWIKKHKEELLPVLDTLFETKQLWYQRFVYVILLDHYLEPAYLNIIFSFCEKPYEKEYYIQMAVAWLLSIALIKFPNETEQYLASCSLDNFTYNKTLQKARESKRISKEKRMLYQSMKIK